MLTVRPTERACTRRGRTLSWGHACAALFIAAVSVLLRDSLTNGLSCCTTHVRHDPCCMTHCNACHAMRCQCTRIAHDRVFVPGSWCTISSPPRYIKVYSDFPPTLLCALSLLRLLVVFFHSRTCHRLREYRGERHTSMTSPLRP